LVLAITISILAFRAVAKDESSRASTAVGLVNGLIIKILDVIYRQLAEHLVCAENPRTVKKYQDSLTLKLFLFYFVNNYTSLFYIAFVKILEPRLQPFDKQDSCQGDCFDELKEQLAGLMISKGLIDCTVNFVNPIFKLYYGFYKKKIHREEHLQDESSSIKELKENVATALDPTKFNHEHQPKDEVALCEYKDTIDDFMQIVIMYGYCIMFAAALPLAPLWCLLVNLLTIGINGRKILHWIRRPEFADCKNLGRWLDIFQFLTIVAVFTNAAIIGITSNVMSTVFDDSDSTMHTGLVLGFEHVVVMVQIYILWVINPDPQGVRQMVSLRAFEQYKVQAYDSVERNKQH